MDFNPENEIVVAPHYNYDEADYDSNLEKGGLSPENVSHDERGILTFSKKKS